MLFVFKLLPMELNMKSTRHSITAALCVVCFCLNFLTACSAIAVADLAVTTTAEVVTTGVKVTGEAIKLSTEAVDHVIDHSKEKDHKK
jgi:hypothetical protein